MALGFQHTSTSPNPAFLDDHRPYFKVNYWDTVYTPESEGIEFSLFTLKDGVAFEAALSTTPLRAELESQLASTGGNTTSVLGYTGTAYNTGVTHSIYKYWGSGALPGITKGRSTVLKFRGDVKATQTVNLFFAGQGTIAVYKNGVSTPILYGTLEEPRVKMPFPYGYTEDATGFGNFADDAGFAYLAGHAFTAGDDLEIYYWHNGEPWGGIAAKTIESTTYSKANTRRYIREGAVLGASFFGIENGGGDLASSTIAYVSGVDLDYNRDSITTATVEVALTTSSQPNGYYWDETNRRLVDNDTSNTVVLKEDRRVEIVAGYAEPEDLKDASGNIAAADTHTRFTGHISKIELADDMKTAKLQCSDFGAKMINTFDENLPDRLSYLANGYFYREGGFEPTYSIPAFDGWPLETVVAEYAYRSGIDAKYLGKGYPTTGLDPNFGRRDAYTKTAQVQRYLRKLFTARYLGDNTKQIKLERNANYGNVGPLSKDYLPDDEEYLYPPELTRRNYDQATEKAEHYGYNFLFDPLGRAYLRPGNNPDEFFTMLDVDTGGYSSTQITSATTTGTWGSPVTEPEALSAQYMFQDTADVFTVVVEGYFGRLDLYASIGGPNNGNGGVLDYQVDVHNGTGWDLNVYNGSISLYSAAHSTEQHFYSGALRSDGTNATMFEVINLPFDRYRVTIDNGGLDAADTGSTIAEYRLNGIGIYYQDPHTNVFPVDFTTDTNVLKLQPGSAKEDLRNHVIVVGKRKGIVADSAKTQYGAETNPNNLDYEFNLAVAADPASIYDKNSSTFVGDKRIAVIYDDKVSDSDFARWLAISTLFRYRDPRYVVPLQTLAIPMLEVGDALNVVDSNQSTLNNVVWVKSFREQWRADEATVDITTSSYPEIPSYQPRMLPDVAGLFDGQAAGNLRVTYKNVLNTTVTNTDLDSDASTVLVKATDNYVAMTHDLNDRQALTTTLMPETLWLEGLDQAANTTKRHRALVNNPYRNFWYVYSWNASNQPTIQWRWEEGSGNTSLSTSLYGQTYYDMPSGSSYVWNLRYKSFTSRGANANPFYDPYISELGNFVNIKFNALIEGRYRVSIWDARRADGQETPVAWLTNPQGDPLEPEDHWQYFDPQADVEFNWDGVDNIGIWNRKQSADYSLRHAGAFGEDGLAVGAGFYAWNDRTTDLHTQIGDDTANNFRDTTPGDIRENDYPWFTIGKYGQFYIKIEVVNDELSLNRAATEELFVLGSPSSVVRSDRDENNNGNLSAAAGHTTDQVYIFTHLGEPTQCEITVQDYDVNNDGLEGDWPIGQTAATGFGTLSDASAHPAIIRNGKPVRFSFTPRPRPGVLFNYDSSNTYMRVTRQVHLQATIFDQFWTFFAEPFEVDSENDVINRRQITSRMYHNNQHTLSIQDSNFRPGDSVSAQNWTFQPNMFQKDFGKGIEEELRYGDYEQLEIIPGYSHTARVGEDRAYITLAFINYLFYFSAYTMDLSGRRQWMINREFVDERMIQTDSWLGSTADQNKLDYEWKGADEFLRRSIFTREWLDSDWKINNTGTFSNTRTPLSPHNQTHLGTGGALDADEQKWLQFAITDLDPLTTDITQAIGGDHTDYWYQAYTSAHDVNAQIREGASATNAATLPNTGSQEICPFEFGTWNFQRGPQGATIWYKPSPKRDFHPFWKPGMPAWNTPYTHYYTASDAGADLSGWNTNAKSALPYLHVLASPGASTKSKPLRDNMVSDPWGGYAFQWAHSGVTTSLKGARLEETVASWASDEQQTNLTYAFDYSRQDELTRYEFFRGIWSRGGYEDRSPYIRRWSSSAQIPIRSGARQPVRPSGLYYVNVARYSDFVVGMASQESVGDLQHFTRNIENWYDIRFHHEYVWYNDRHFPVAYTGGAVYEFYRHEYTKIFDNYRHWAFGLITGRTALLYDSGAWVGWKDDIKAADGTYLGWTNAPLLRWGESISRGGRIYDPGPPVADGRPQIPDEELYSEWALGTSLSPWSSGGFKFHDTAAPYTGSNEYTQTNYTDYWHDLESVVWKARNIFDSGNGEWSTFRLAVGKEVPQSREINMNLVLPTRLRG